MREIIVKEYRNKQGLITRREVGEELVRCKECKHMTADGRCLEFADDALRPSASDFCSYGEREGE